MLIIWHFKVGSRSTTYFQPHILTICGSEIFLEIKQNWALSAQIQSNTTTPCTQLEYLLEIRLHSLKNLVWNPGPMGPWPTLPSDFFFKMANCPVSSLIPPLNYITMSSYFEYQVKSSTSFVTNSIWNFEVSPHIEISKMSASSCIDN